MEKDIKQFAAISWDFRDVPSFSKQQSEEFLAEHEEVIRQRLAEVGHNLIADLLSQWVPKTKDAA